MRQESFKSFKSSVNKPFERNLTYPLYLGFAVKMTCHRSRSAYREGNNEKTNYYVEGTQKFEAARSGCNSFSKVLKAVEQNKHHKALGITINAGSV